MTAIDKLTLIQNSKEGTSMKLRSLLAITGLILLLMPAAVFASEHFSVKQYEKFHDVLQPLQHEALPNKDFVRIRSNAVEFVRLGRAIVKVGVPAGVAKTKVVEFRKELKKFNSALNKFSRIAKVGADSDLESSFSAVHDSFELLAEMLPRK
jgi:hypothetical protein